MRQLNILSTVGTTTLDLSTVEFLNRGERLLIAACDSVATATLNVMYGGVQVSNGPINIEGSTDRCVWPGDIVGSFIAPVAGKVIAALGGTVAGARTNFMVLSGWGSVFVGGMRMADPDRETVPW